MRETTCKPDDRSRAAGREDSVVILRSRLSRVPDRRPLLQALCSDRVNYILKKKIISSFLAFGPGERLESRGRAVLSTVLATFIYIEDSGGRVSRVSSHDN